jgi:hypothetical protein
VRRGGSLFSKPNGFSDAQWVLVVGACRFAPKERLRMAEMVVQLEVFANDAITSETIGSGKRGVLTEPEPEMENAASEWSDSPAISVAGLDILPIGSLQAKAISYSDSW